MGRESNVRVKILRKLNRATPTKTAPKKQLDELSAVRQLYELSVLPVSQDNLAAIMQQSLDMAINFSGADMGNIQLFNEESGALEIIVHRGFQRPFLEFFAAVYPEEGGCGAACGASFARMQRVIVEDVTKSPIFAGTPALSVMLAAEALACQSTPLLSHGQLVGMLNTHFRKPICKADLGLRYVDLLAGQVADIIVQVRATAALQTSEEKYRRLFESMNEGFAIIEMLFDDSGRPIDYIMLEINPAWERQAGIGKKHVLGKRVTEFLPVVEHIWIERYGEVVTSGEAKRFEEYNVSLNRWYEVFAYPLHRGNRFAVIFTDITVRKQIEQELALYRENLERLVDAQTEEIRHSERHYRTLVENVPLLIGKFDREFRYLYMSPWAKELGFSSEAIIGKTWSELGLSEEVYRPWQEKFTEALTTGRTTEYESRYPDHNGEIRDFLVQIVPEVDGTGRVESFLTVAQDITGRKKMEEELRQSEERFRQIFSSSPAMMTILRMSDDRYVEVNQKFLDALEYTREEVIGRTPTELKIPAEAIGRQKTLFADLRKTGSLPNAEYNLRTKSERIIIVLAVASLAKLGGELCRIVTMQDITNEKQLEAELLRLDRLNTVGEMAAAIGHEVRNPLTTVRGYLQMFQRRAESAEYLEQFKTMIEELDRANLIISDFLSLAKNRIVELTPHNLNDAINSLLPLLQAEALRTSHDIKFAMGEIADFAMDEKEIRQLILNLTRNGFEAMKTGGRLTIMTYEQMGKIVLGVHDTGPGIPTSVLDKLGTPFTTTKENGTGLGLAVCFRIAERHDAKIDVRTSPDGTTFTISFPK